MRVPRLAKVAFFILAVAALSACQPEGHLDHVTTGDGVVHLAGWARDPDTTGPIHVHVYADGKFVGDATAVGARPDVQAAKAGTDTPAGADHGFDITIPVPAGTRQVCVYGIDQVGGDANSLIGCTAVVRCVVALHGLGGNGRATQTGIDGVRYVYPSGNASAATGRRWVYGAAAEYAAARDVVQRAIDDNGCGRVVIDGFSNGGGFAGRLYCQGETFGGTTVGYVLDDPVTDHGADGCRHATGANVAMYWTGALDFAPSGFDCRSVGWTCFGDSLVGRDTYAAQLGTAARASIHTSHQPYMWPEEIGRWL